MAGLLDRSRWPGLPDAWPSSCPDDQSERAGRSFPAQSDLSPAGGPARKAIGDGEYPWYDSRADRVQPVWPLRISWLEWLGERIDAFFRWLSKLFDEDRLRIELACFGCGRFDRHDLVVGGDRGVFCRSGDALVSS